MTRLDSQLSRAEANEIPAILDEMTRIERNAEQDWLAGRINTEDMENFYERTGAKIRNVYIRMLDNRIQTLHSKLEGIRNGQEAIRDKLWHDPDRQSAIQ